MPHRSLLSISDSDSDSDSDCCCMGVWALGMSVGRCAAWIGSRLVMLFHALGVGISISFWDSRRRERLCTHCREKLRVESLTGATAIDGGEW